VLVCIVRISGTAAAFRSLLDGVEGAAFVRDLPPDRVVITLPAPADVARVAALDGVESVTHDQLRRPLRPRPSGHPPPP
jgi:hypothetical protein